MATATEIRETYDVGNEFFRLWLDERMNYSCAVWRDGDTLETAQDNKLDILHDFARIGADSKVLDIGCGWGANLQRLVEHRGVRASHGLTLSPSQREEILQRQLPGVVVDLADYRTWQAPGVFDALISICMFEHIATPEQARRGEHMLAFTDYFRRTRQWAAPGARFALQLIVINKLPRNRDDIRDLATATRKVLPGSKCPRLEEVVESSSPYWETMEIVTRRADYALTCQAWLDRLRANEQVIRDSWGDTVYDDYDHYLRSCVVMFQKGYLSVAQFSLRRIDD